MERKRIWQGDAAGDRWELHVTGVDEGPVTYPGATEGPEGEPFVIGAHRIAWRLTLSSRMGERLELWWDPENRVLGGPPLRGWDKSAIGVLKRHLIELGIRP